MVGGYILIDCTGIELTAQTKKTISGLHKRIAEAMTTKKPIIACGITFENNVMSPVSVMITLRPSGSYIATASTLQIIVDEDDGVTINNMLTE